MKSWTNMVPAVTLTLALISSYCLYREMTFRMEKTGGEAIGAITFKKKSATRRYTDTIVWEKIEENSEIYNYDAIRTLDYSSAVITLKNGTAIELAENTLLIVVINDSGVDINFERGRISARTGEGDQGMVRLNASDASISFSEGDISVNRGDSGMDIQMNSGNAEVSASGENIGISSDTVLSLINGKAELREGRLVPVFPKNNGVILTFGTGTPFNLSWESDMEGDLKVELSRNSSFSPPLAVYSTRGKSVRVNPGEGSYYWRLVKGGVTSIPAVFSVAVDRKPYLLAPYNNQKIITVEGSEMVSFRWGKADLASSYEVVISKDSEATESVLQLVSRVNAISTDKLEPGEYYWKVRSVYPDQIVAEGAESAKGRFTLERSGFAMTKPVPLNQGPVTTAGPFRLGWTGVPGGRSYRIEISAEKDFRNIITSAESDKTFIHINEVLSPGRYYWRVGALRGDLVSALSDTAVQEIIKPLDIIPLSPVAGAVIVPGIENIRFAWRDPNSGGKYLFELSEDRDFVPKKIVREADLPSAEIKNPGPGVYFWRVIMQGEEGKSLTESPVQNFSVPRILTAPLPLSPGKNEKVVPAINRKLRFEWVRSAEADEYEVEIFQRIAGAERSLSIFSSKESHMEMTNVSMFRPGNYSWVVRAKKISEGRITGFNESGKHFFEVYEPAILPPPVVRKPEIIFYQDDK